MKSIGMIILALLLLMTACTSTAFTDRPVETNSTVPSSTPLPPTTPMQPTPALESTPVSTITQTSASQTPAQTYPIPYISDLLLYSHTDLFSQDDLVLGPVAIASTQEDILRILGEPDQIIDKPSYALGPAKQYRYACGEMTFLLIDDTYILHEFLLTGGDFKTPRDIGIGSFVRDVIQAYVDQLECTVLDNLAIFYRSNTDSISLKAVPPSGIMWRGSSSTAWMLQFSIPVETNPYAGYTQEQIEEMYTSMWHYSLRFSTKYGTVRQISMTMGPYAE